MQYKETLDFMYAQLPMFHRIGAAAFKKDLSNTLALCEALGRPQEQFASIHVAGTNGKGSVSNMLAAVCQAAGLKTGLYTSPHYRDFRERIRVNGQMMSRKAVVDFVTQHQALIRQIQPSFFEMTVAMAFDYFAKQKVDIAIIEVGLGGRLDSTNVIRPLCSVITNISYDHMDMLGYTLEKIASEKAGIIKPHTPVVIGETQAETTPVFQAKADQAKTSLVFADQQFTVRDRGEMQQGCSVFDIQPKNGPATTLAVDANGPYQAKNIATVLQTCAVMQQLPFFASKNIHWDTALKQGLGHLKAYTGFMGRWQIVGHNPTIILDSAHNEAGIRFAFRQLQDMPFRQLHIVTGSVNDKDLNKALPLYPSSATYYFAKANIPRGLDADLLQAKAAAFGLTGKTYRSVRAAYQAARRAASPDDLILVIGSIFVVAEVVPSHTKHPKDP